MTLRQLIAAFFINLKYWVAFRLLAREEWDKISPLNPDEAVEQLTDDQISRLEALAEEFAE